MVLYRAHLGCPFENPLTPSQIYRTVKEKLYINIHLAVCIGMQPISFLNGNVELTSLFNTFTAGYHVGHDNDLI